MAETRLGDGTVGNFQSQEVQGGIKSVTTVRDSPIESRIKSRRG